MRTAKRFFIALLATMLVLASALPVFAASMTKQGAINKALQCAGVKKSAVQRLKAERDGGTYEVEFRVKKSGDKHEYEFRVRDGLLKEASVEYKHARNTSKKKISSATAINKVAKAARVSNNTVKKGSCRYKRDDGEWIYEIKFRSGKYKYEYEVLAPTGKIISYSKEYKG